MTDGPSTCGGPETWHAMRAELRLQGEEIMNAKQTRVRVMIDRDCESPRKDENFGTMLCWHPNYDLGDEKIPRGDLERIEERIAALPEGTIILPLGFYDHSGISMYVGSVHPMDPGRWDSGNVGIIYATPEKIRENFMVVGEITPEILKRAEEVLRGEVEYYDKYLRGECYGYTIETAETCNLGHVHWTATDSCWGFIGSNVAENGMIESIPEELHEQLIKAMENPE
jgi:hypothetical protein